MLPCFRLFTFVTIFCSLQNIVSAFTFSTTPPTQCDDFTVRWHGGTPPFLLHLIPIFDAPRNITVPPTAFNNGNGVFSVQVPFAKDQKMMVVMSDAQGFGTGGVSDVETVGPSRGSSTCDTKGPGPAFTFDLNTSLKQCRPFTFSGYTGAVQPVTIYAIIPQGQFLVLNPPVGPTSFDWNANVASGTNIVFFLVDSQGRQGGTSDVSKVAISSDSTCLDKTSPSSTTSAPSSTTSPTSISSAAPTSTNASSKNNGFSVAAIAATVIGVLLFLAIVITMSMYFFRRKRDRPAVYPPLSPYAEVHTHASYVDMVGAAPTPRPYGASSISTNSSTYPLRAVDQFSTATSAPYGTVPYQSSSRMGSEMELDPSAALIPTLSNPYDSRPPPPQQQPESHPFAAVGQAGASTSARVSSYNTNTSTTSTSTTKSKMGRTILQPPPRFVLHTDAEDTVPEQDESGVVELPPMYTERRALIVANPTPSELPYARPPSGASYPNT